MLGESAPAGAAVSAPPSAAPRPIRPLREGSAAPASPRAALARWLGALLLLAAGVAAGWLAARRLAPGEAAAAPRAETAVVARRDVAATILATGVVRPATGAQVAVGSRASGVLRRLHVRVGDRVAAGQLLAELDDAELATQVARAEAALATARAERRWADEELARAGQLVAREMAPATELSAARRTAEMAQAREQEAAAVLAAARVQHGFARIRAPIGGIVGSIATQEGETVAASFAAPTFLTIVDLERLQLWTYVDETDVGRVAVGQAASFTVDSWPDERFEGRVVAVRPIAELRDNVVNYVALVEIAAGGARGRLLRPEMSATVNVALDARRNVLAVPNGALRRDGDGSYVLVAAGDLIERRAVRLGLRGSTHSEVEAGLREGERVVLGSGRANETMDETMDNTRAGATSAAASDRGR